MLARLISKGMLAAIISANTPAMISVSKKLSAAAHTRTTTSPAPAVGSAISAISRTSGPP